MKYFLLIFTALMVISMFNPKNLKIGTLKGVANRILENVKGSKESTIAALHVTLIFSIIYCIAMAVYINSFAFTLVMSYWIAQSLCDHSLITQYLTNKTEGKLLNSYVYRGVSRIIDCAVYGYIIYFLMINW